MSLIALIDGPLSPDHPALAGRVDPLDSLMTDSPAARHAAAMAEAILSAAPGARFLSLPIFRGGLSAPLSDLLDALVAAEESQARIVHCSLGIGRDDPGLAWRIARLRTSGRIVIAAAAARGGPVWPAACPGVISVQGDARCGAGQWSKLDLPGAEYGAAPRCGTDRSVAGASVAAAHLTGVIAWLGCGTEAAARAALDHGAAFFGRERRSAAMPG